MGIVRGRGRVGAGVRAIRRWGVSLTKDISEEGAASFETQGVVTCGGGQLTGLGLWCSSMSAFLTWCMEGACSVCAELFSRFDCVRFAFSVRALRPTPLFEGPSLGFSSDWSKKCCPTASKSKNPEASLRYRASSTPRLGPETWTRISTGWVIA